MKRILQKVVKLVPLAALIVVLVAVSGCFTGNAGGSNQQQWRSQTVPYGQAAYVVANDSNGTPAIVPGIAGQHERHNSWDVSVDTNPLSWLKKIFGSPTGSTVYFSGPTLTREIIAVPVNMIGPPEVGYYQQQPQYGFTYSNAGYGYGGGQQQVVVQPPPPPPTPRMCPPPPKPCPPPPKLCPPPVRR